MANRIFNSLKGRLFTVSLLVLPVICGLLGWTLDQAHNQSLLKSQKRQMTLQTYALMASAEMEDSQLWLPQQMTDDRLNQLSSDYYASVYDVSRQKVVWSSLSYTGTEDIGLESALSLTIGTSSFGNQNLAGADVFFLHYKLEWEDELGNNHPFLFSVFETKNNYLLQLKEYRQSLWVWLTIIAITLICIQAIILNWGLRPIDTVSRDLLRVQEGKKNALSGKYPAELVNLTSSINKLIQHELSQRERYRNTLSDLAHSIKNPLTIIGRALDGLKAGHNNQNLSDINEQHHRIDQIISYQLTRAVSQSGSVFHPEVQIKPLLSKITNALSKVYADKNIKTDLLLDDNMTLRCDTGDLMELFGNLVDNAYKYGQSTVRIKLAQDKQKLTIIIEDDGPGISEKQRTTLLKRGARADESLPGQGIGLAVVEDIIHNYEGCIELNESLLGGLCVTVTLPN